MMRARAAIGSAAFLMSVSIAVPTQAATGCGAVRSDFPNGVARTERAKLAYAAAWRKPAVDRVVYRKYSHLDRDSSGTVCKVRPPAAAPGPVGSFTARGVTSPDGAPAILAEWSRVRAWPEPVQYAVLVNDQAAQGDLTASIGGPKQSLMLSDLQPATTYG